MSDDLNKKIKQITDILGQENLPDNLKGLLSLLSTSAGSGAKEESSPSRETGSLKPDDAPASRDERVPRNELEDNVEMMRKIKKVMDRMNSSNDPRVNLLTAIRPFLNNSRQKKLSNAIKLLHMSSVARLMDDDDKGNF